MRLSVGGACEAGFWRMCVCGRPTLFTNLLGPIHNNPMVLKCNTRKNDGKIHRYWSINESQRTSKGTVVQRQVLYLGEINSSQQDAGGKPLMCSMAKANLKAKWRCSPEMVPRRWMMAWFKFGWINSRFIGRVSTGDVGWWISFGTFWV